ncbi:MAG: hypothetical protein R3B45_06285 [Bdellovibrionota bacterium]
MAKHYLFTNQLFIAILVALSSAIISKSTYAAIVSYSDVTQSITYIDLHPTDRQTYKKGQKIIIESKNPPSKFYGKILERNGNRITVSILQGIYYLRPGMMVGLSYRKFRKKIGNKAVQIVRTSPLYKNRRNLSLMGDLAIVTDIQLLLFGGSLGISLPYNLEIEAHGLFGTTEKDNTTATASYYTAHMKAFLNNIVFAYAGFGYRSYTVEKKKNTSTNPNTEQQDPPNEDLPTETTPTAIPSRNFSDDIIGEVGLGARWQFRTLTLGNSFILSLDVGYWPLLQVSNSEEVLNPDLDKAIPLPDGQVFFRANIGLSF